MGKIIFEPMNIIFPLQGEDVWLAIKTRKIGVGLWNGYGGKLEPEQSMEESCVNEFRKESLISTFVENYQKVAMVDFFIHKEDDTIKLNRCHIYFLTEFNGIPQATVEMENPTLFPKDKLPYEKMMKDAELWIPQVMHGENIYAEVHYNHNRTELLSFDYRHIEQDELFSEKWDSI